MYKQTKGMLLHLYYIKEATIFKIKIKTLTFFNN